MFSKSRTARTAAGTIAATTAMVAAMLGAAVAGADTDDDQFVDIATHLGVKFSSTQAAGEAGRGMCNHIAAGVSQGADDAAIRSGLITGLSDAGLADGQAADLVRGAVKTYCPRYGDVVAG